MATQTKAQVKAIQTALNAKGANLKVDGIAGPLTNAAIAKYGSTPTTTTSAKSTSTGTVSGKSTKPVATTQASSYNKYSISKPSGGTISSAPKKTKVGSILSSIGNVFKDAIGTNNKSGYASNPYTYNNGLLTDTPRLNQNQVKGAIEDLSYQYQQPIKETFSGKPLIASASEPTSQYLTSSTMPLVSTESGSTTEQTTPTVNPIEPNKMLGNSGTETTKTTETVNPMTGEVTTMSETSPLGSTASVNNTSNMDSANKFNTAMLGLDSTVTSMKNNPWDKYRKNGDVVSVADTKINQALGAYTDVASFMNDYQTNPEVKKNVDNYLQVTGKTINDVKSKIQPVTNGVVAPQSVDEFLINNKNANLKSEADNLNKAMILNSDFNTQQEKMAYTANEEFKKTQEAIRDSLERNELRKEASVREKANWMIDKNKAEMEIALADIEQNRLLGKNSLTGLLAKLGALDTTSQAGIALTDLDQKYQAQQSSTRAKYLLANREIQMNMNSDINDLENAMEENIIKINSDLSKSEREVTMEVMKLRYDTQKTALEYKMKYEDALRVEKEKAIAKAEKNASDWTNAYLTTTGADMFKSLPAEFRNQWLQNNPINAQGFKTTQQDLAKDYATWSKNQANQLKMTTAEEYKLQQSGVDVDKYKTDEGYRTFVNSNLTK